MAFPITSLFSVITFGTLISIAQCAPAQAAVHHLSAEDFMKVRCNPKGTPSFTRWSGQVTTSGPASDKAQTLFKIIGFNVARCYPDASGNWTVTSRELTYFLDPISGELIDTWLNPWTSEKLPIVHIANSLVQQKISSKVQIPVEMLGDSSILRLDVPLSYPNPLASESRFADYSPEAFYKAHESFTYVVSTEEIRNIASLDSLQKVQVSWTRVSPWMPWMKMKGSPGYLVFNAIVRKVERFEDLPQLIQRDIYERLPLYGDAPQCIVAGRPNVSSWTYFKENFDAYLSGSKFPLSAPLNQTQGECPEVP